MFLGCGLRPNTSMHAVEELVIPPYLFAGVTEYGLVASDGTRCAMAMRNHGFDGWVQRYDRIAQVLPPAAMRFGTVLDAECHLLECEAMRDAALAALRRDPLYFVEPA